MSSPRTALHLLAPPPPERLHERFPSWRCPAGTEVFRCHGAEHGPLWFANAGYGRFDLAHTHACLALLDTAGARSTEGEEVAAYSVVTTSTLIERGDLMQELQQDTGITVLPVPHSL